MSEDQLIEYVAERLWETAWESARARAPWITRIASRGQPWRDVSQENREQFLLYARTAVEAVRSGGGIEQ